MSHRVAMAILEDFEANQDVALGRLRKYHLKHYADVVTRPLALEIEITPPDLASSEGELAVVVSRRAAPSTASERAAAR